MFTDINTEDGRTLSRQQRKIGLLLLKTLRILQFTSKSDSSDEQFAMEPLGSAIYTSMAFLNHSCNPNTIKYWEGDRMVVMACQPVKKGEEVTDNYGMHFTVN